MHRLSTLSLTVSLCLLLCAAPSFAQAVNPSGAVVSQVEAEKWREDLRYMAREMEARHKNLFHTMTRAQFERYASLDTAQRKNWQARLAEWVNQRFGERPNPQALEGDCAVELQLPNEFL